MTFEEFQKKKKEGTLISNGSSMSFEEFKQKKADGTLLSNDSKANAQNSFKSVNINQFIQDKFLPTENTAQTKAPTVTSNENFTADDVARRMRLKQNRENTQQLVKNEFAKEQEAERQEKERWNNLSFGQKIVDPFKTAGANIQHSNLGIQESQAWNEYRSKQDAESLAKAEQATKAREEYEKSNDRIGKGNAFTKDFAGYLPQLGGQLLSGLGNAAGGATAGAVGGAGTALVAGQLGPQVLVPEEIATVPAGAVTGALWGGRAGYVAGVANYSYDLMAGSAYKSLLDMGIPNEVALELSHDEAIINSLIEGTGAVVDLISLGLGKLASKSSLTVAQKLAQNKLIQAGAAYGMNLVSEPMEEMAQEKVSIETEKKAADIAGIERQATEAQDRERIKESGLSALKISAISGGGNIAGNVITNKINDTMTAKAEQKQLDQDVKDLQQEYQTRQAMETYKKLSPYSKYQPAQVETNISTKDIKPRTALPEGGKIYVDPQGVAVDSRNYVAPSENNVQNGQYSPVNARQVIQNPIKQENVEKIDNQQKNVASELPTNAFQGQSQQTILPTQKVQETVNSAKIAGMSDFDVEKATEIHKMLQSGTKLKFYDPQNIPEGVNPEKASRANGFYQDGVLWLNKNSDRKVQKIIGHELTHYLEDTQVYKDFSESILKSNLFYDYITSEGFDNVEQFKNNLRRRGYKDHELEYEMVSIFVEDNLFDSQEKINRLARENRTLAQKILNWLSDMKTKLVGTSQEKELLRIENMYRKALEQARNVDTTSTDAQYSYSGEVGLNNLKENRKNMNFAQRRFVNELETNYNTAVEMDKQGATNEQILKDTGWFKAGGKWRWEIPDTLMTLKPDIQLKDGVSYDLADILQHDLLFMVYPDLMTQQVVIDNNMNGKGKYNTITKNIKLKVADRSKGNIELTLLHEVQHAIQDTEGFEGGTSPLGGKLRYYEHKGEIEAADTTRRLLQERQAKKNGEIFDREKVAPELSKENPEHPGLKDYLASDKQTKIRDNIYKRFKGGAGNETESFDIEDVELENNETNNETLGQNNSRRRVAGREPAFSLPETDNQGRKLSAEQQEFFKDSKVRDEDGNLQVMYHGTPNGTFTEFKTGTYFTSNKKYADQYQSQGASSLSYKRTAEKPSTYEVYLNIKKPFDTRNSREKEIFMNEFHNKWSGTPLSESGLPDWTDGMDLQEFIEENGYDYDGLILDEGAIGGYGDEIQSRGLSYVVFNPEQVKNVDNTKPTENADIRFSLNEPIEETKDLIALHNLSEDKLKGVLELGGFPSPSIAISRADIQHDGFGNISVIFDKSTIDPTNKANEVYDRDVWSPTFPQVDYTLNEEAIENVADKLGIEDWKLADYAEESDTPAGLAYKLSQNDKVLDKFIEDKNITYETKYKTTQLKRKYHEDEILQKWIKENDITHDKLANDIEVREKYFELADLKDAGDYITSLNNALDKYAYDKGVSFALSPIVSDLEYIRNGAKTTIDEYATRKEKEKAAEENDLKGYLEKEVQSVFGEKGIRNDKDIFTASGNRRSFWQLHDEYNLENIVEAMTKKNTKGSQKTLVTGFGHIQSQMAKRFRSIEEIKANKGQLTDLSVENELLTELRRNLENDIEKIGDKYKYPDSYNSPMSLASELVADFAQRGKFTVESFNNLLAKDYEWFNPVDSQTVEQLIEDLKALGNIPTDYFEAKPQRAVGFDEVLAVVVPNDTNSSLKQQLQEQGVNVVEYDSKVEGDRLRAVNSVEDAKFSLNAKEETSNTRSTSHSLLDEIAPINESKLEDVEEEKVANILTRTPKTKAKDMLRQSKDVLMRKLVDAGHTIDTVGKITGDKNLYQYFNNTKQARQSAEYMIGEAQTDIQGNRVGNSLMRVFEPIRAKGDEYTNKFFEYLLHMHNIDRMKQNKPVFGKSVTAEDSSLYVKELLKEYPEFEKAANKVYAYNRNLMQWRVDSGLISQEQADIMNEMYPHYVPTFRNVSGTAGSRVLQGGVQVANTVRKATGSNKDILPIDASMARQTMQTVQAAKRNLLGNRLLNDVLNNKEKVAEYVQAVEKTSEKTDLAEEMDNAKDSNLDLNNTFKIFRNGETYLMQVNNGIYEGLKSISSEIDNTDTNVLLKPVKAANNMFKKLITGYSPMFTIKNFARDIQDSGLYARELRKFMKNYPKTYTQMIGNGELWQLYKSLGGTGSSFFDYDSGIEKAIDSKNKLGTKIKESTVGKIEQLNMMIEQAPRFAEFMSTIEKAGNQNYDTLMEAMLNAADVTVNFGRSGTWGNFLNSTFVPFFNPSIQGFDKMGRTFLEGKAGKQFAKLAIRATLLGIAPTLINELLLGDDDDYENLSDRDKDTNFIIKLGDNKWLKIPKGRVLSIFGNTASRVLKTMRGEEWDVGEFVKNQLDQTAPISPFDSNIVSPIMAVQNNKTWYGSKIVPQRLEGYAPKDQYDEKTDVFSKWLGSKINYSPKKINYLIDAYTGIIGDVALPLSTPKAETNPFTKAFVIDGVTNNEISNDFYNMLDEYNPKQSNKESAKEVTRYLNKQSTQVSDINKQIREIENSGLSNAEKKKQVRELRELINTIELTAMATVPQYEKAVEKYKGTFADEEVDSDYAYLFANRDIFGAEYAVKTFSKSLYNNHKDENMEKFFRNYFTREYFQKKLEPEKKSTNALPTLSNKTSNTRQLPKLSNNQNKQLPKLQK